MITAHSHKVNPSEIRKNWIPNEPFACMVLNAAHLLLPHGELWMCRTFNQAKPLIKDQKILQDVNLFIQQEGNHAKAHKVVITRFSDQGAGFEQSHTLLTRLFHVILGEKIFGLWNANGKWAFRWLKFRIGLIAILEHVTCVLGGWLVENTAFEAAGADDEMITIFKWHGAEEIEHRSVAHDLHTHLGGSHLFRAVAFLPFSILTIYLWIRATKRFLQNSDDNEVNYGMREYVKASRRGLLPTIGYLVFRSISYFKFGFHPEKDIHEQTLSAVESFNSNFDNYER